MPLRHKIVIPALQRDASNNITTTASGQSVQVLKAGAVVNEGVTIGNASAATVDVYTPGALRNGDNVFLLREGDPPQFTESNDYTITADHTYSTANDDFTVNLSSENYGGETTQDGDILFPSRNFSSNQITLYSDSTSSNVVTVDGNGDYAFGSNGILEAYIEETVYCYVIHGASIDTAFFVNQRVGDDRRENALDWGCWADGSTDDTPALDIFFHWCADQNKTAYLPGPKVYQMATGISMDSTYNNLVIEGDGDEVSDSQNGIVNLGTVLRTSADIEMFTLAGTQYNRWSGFKLLCTNVTPTNPGINLSTIAADWNIFRNLTISGFNDGFQIDGDDNFVERCAFDDLDNTGVLVTGDRNHVIRPIGYTVANYLVDLQSGATRNTVTSPYNDANAGNGNVLDSGTESILIPGSGYGSTMDAAKFQGQTTIAEPIMIEGSSISTISASVSVDDDTSVVWVDASAGGSTINSITTWRDGRILILLVRDVTSDLTLTHENSGTPTNNELQCPNFTDVTVRRGGGVMLVGSNATGANMWHVVSI